MSTTNSSTNTLNLKPGDRIRLPHWPRWETVAKADKDAVWLNDNKGGSYRYKLTRPWIKDDGRPAWVKWTGGKAPTLKAVEIKLRDGRTIEMPEGCPVDWAHSGAASDIVEWRLM